jgi:AcrR family transcriptional regulator
MINTVAGLTHVEAFPARTRRTARPRRSGQRQRLLRAITRLAIDEGYGDVSVAQVVARAGVSRATFYECFDDKEECFVAALAPLAEQLLAAIHRRVARERPEHAIGAATWALLAYARSQPANARLLMSDSLTAPAGCGTPAISSSTTRRGSSKTPTGACPRAWWSRTCHHA